MEEVARLSKMLYNQIIKVKQELKKLQIIHISLERALIKMGGENIED